MISYKKVGNSKTVIILCHGFGEASFIWSELVLQLSTTYTCIIPSLPGCEKTNLYDYISIDGMANDIYNIMLHEQITTSYFVGHSMGGYIGLAFAKKHESLLLGLLLVNSTIYADTLEKIDARKKINEFIEANTVLDYAKISIPNLYSKTSSTLLKNSINTHIAQTAALVSKEALIAQNNAMIERSSSETFIKETHLPIGFVIGKDDEVIPLEKSLAQSILPEKSYVKILDNVGHMSMQETNIAPFIIEFIEA
jgi:pimeloyl-ACP methyl ester carboxylesterase